jgi:hypothetical protein
MCERRYDEMSERLKSDKELATELTIAVIKARAEIIGSIDAENIVAKKNNTNELLNDSVVTDLFNKIHAAIAEKTY